MNVRHALSAMALAVAALGSAACTAPVAGDDVVNDEAPLLQAPGITKWPNGLVPICFVSRPSAREVGWVKDALAKSWAAVANVGFVYSDTCPFVGQTSFVQFDFVALDSANWGSRGVASALGVASTNRVDVWYCAPGNPTGCLPGGARDADYEESFRSVVVHEIGHVLGFAHEQQRNDATPSCPLDPNDGNNVKVGGIYLTPTYDPDSIMNYCRGWDGTAPLPYQLGYKGAEKLSQGDIDGVRQAYGPRRMTVSSNPSAVAARVPQTFTVSARDIFGQPVVGGEVYLNGTKLGNVGQAVTATFPTKISTVCVWVRDGNGKPYKECDLAEVVAPFTLDVRAANYSTTKVNLQVNL